MNYQHLVYFKTVAELQHYTKAADQLCMTQPALTKAIQGLESEIGAKLFQKSGRNAVLTKYGKIFYEYVQRSINEVNAGIEAVQHQIDIDSNRIFITALNSMYQNYLPEKIIRFRRMYPNCTFASEFKYSTAVLNDVLSGRSELGICSNFETEGKYAPLEKHMLYQEPICLIAPRDHPLAKKKLVSIPDLKNEKFVFYYKSFLGTNRILYNMCASYGFDPIIAGEGYNDYGVINMVASGEGLAIVPLTDFFRSGSVVILNLDVKEPFYREINLIWLKNGIFSDCVRAFRDMLIEESE